MKSLSDCQNQTFSSSGLPLRNRNEFYFTSMQALLINTKMPSGYKLEKASLISASQSKINQLKSLKKFRIGSEVIYLFILFRRRFR